MTPTALTPAARGQKTPSRRAPTRPAAKAKAKPRTSPGAGKRATQAASRTSSARSAGHRAIVGEAASPRRVSGPLGGLTAPRRTSGPARTAPRRGHASKRLPRGAVGTRAAAFIRALPDHSLLDRIVRGRAWIPLLGVLLAGIVAMQVETLKLSAGTGRALERGTALASRNEQLRASVAVLADEQRIERLAFGMGMVMPGPTTVKFLSAHRNGDVQRALNGIHPPNATTFLASLPAAANAASAGATPVTASGTPIATAPASTTTVTGVPAAGVATGAGAPPAGATPTAGATTTPGTTTPAVTAPPSAAPATTPAGAGTPATAAPPGAAPPGATAAPTTPPATTTPTGATAVTPGG